MTLTYKETSSFENRMQRRHRIEYILSSIYVVSYVRYVSHITLGSTHRIWYKFAIFVSHQSNFRLLEQTIYIPYNYRNMANWTTEIKNGRFEGSYRNALGKQSVSMELVSSICFLVSSKASTWQRSHDFITESSELLTIAFTLLLTYMNS